MRGTGWGARRAQPEALSQPAARPLICPALPCARRAGPLEVGQTWKGGGALTPEGVTAPCCCPAFLASKGCRLAGQQLSRRGPEADARDGAVWPGAKDEGCEAQPYPHGPCVGGAGRRSEPCPGARPGTWDRGHLGDTDLAWAQSTRARVPGGCCVGPTRAGICCGAGRKTPPDDSPRPRAQGRAGLWGGGCREVGHGDRTPVRPPDWGVGKQPLLHACRRQVQHEESGGGSPGHSVSRLWWAGATSAAHHTEGLGPRGAGRAWPLQGSFGALC